jgi:hypothetical protein
MFHRLCRGLALVEWSIWRALALCYFIDVSGTLCLIVVSPSSHKCDSFTVQVRSASHSLFPNLFMSDPDI